MDKETLEVNIFGVKLNIKSQDGIEYLESLASFVDENMNEIGSKYDGGHSKEVIAILTCLNFADRLRKIEKENEDNKYLIDNIKASISSRIGNLIELIESESIKIDKE